VNDWNRLSCFGQIDYELTSANIRCANLVSEYIVDMVDPIHVELLCLDCLNLIVQPVLKALQSVPNEGDDIAA
jgi:hypothetical protein